MAEIPKTRLQARALLFESIGNALVKYAFHLRGLDPITTEIEDEPERTPQKLADLKEDQPLRQPTVKRKHAPPVKDSDARKAFIELSDGDGEFTVKQVADKLGVGMGAATRAIERSREVVKSRESAMRGGVKGGRTPAFYKFDATAGKADTSEFDAPPAEPRPKKALHPEREDGTVSSMPRVSDSEMQALILETWNKGWSVVLTAGGHVKFKSPDGVSDPVMGPSTPSDYRSVKNLRAQLKRAGLDAAEIETPLESTPPSVPTNGAVPALR